MFEPNDILNGTYYEATATKISMPPAGQYLGTIIHDSESQYDSQKITAKEGEYTNKQGETRPWMLINVPFRLAKPDDPSHEGHDKTSRMTLFLDLVDGPNGTPVPDFSGDKNIALGKLREAVGQNTAGEQWSPMMLAGQSCNVSVEHETAKKAEADGTFRTYANVTAVAAL